MLQKSERFIFGKSLINNSTICDGPFDKTAKHFLVGGECEATMKCRHFLQALCGNYCQINTIIPVLCHYHCPLGHCSIVDQIGKGTWCSWQSHSYPSHEFACCSFGFSSLSYCQCTLHFPVISSHQLNATNIWLLLLMWSCSAIWHHELFSWSTQPFCFPSDALKSAVLTTALSTLHCRQEALGWSRSQMPLHVGYLIILLEPCYGAVHHNPFFAIEFFMWVYDLAASPPLRTKTNHFLTASCIHVFLKQSAIIRSCISSDAPNILEAGLKTIEKPLQWCSCHDD